MKDEKYYTPQLEEIHNGFECEIKIVTGAWLRKVFDHNTVFIPKRLFENDEIRVKHLDHDDIVSLGWADSSSEYAHYSIKINGERLFMFMHPNRVKIYNDDDFCIFSGHLLNKSELSRLMRQLGIKKQDAK